jgi:membrane associated rhomboid family serine protease
MPRINITPVVLNLIIINVLVFITYHILVPDPADMGKLEIRQWFDLFKSDLIIPRPFDLFKPLQIVTHFFSHYEIWHIFLNMFALVSFGSPLETVMGSKRFLIAYLVIGLGAGTLAAFLDPSYFPVIGASGALFGMMVLFAFYFPHTKLGLFLLPFQFNVKKFMIGAFVISAALIIIEVTTGNEMGRISHFGHAAGMLMGFAYLHIGKLRKTMKR